MNVNINEEDDFKMTIELDYGETKKLVDVLRKHKMTEDIFRPMNKPSHDVRDKIIDEFEKREANYQPI